MTLMDAVMLSLPIVSLIAGWVKWRWENTNSFEFGFFCGSLIALIIYAQTGDSGLTWLKV
jgi:hypothetical protein